MTRLTWTIEAAVLAPPGYTAWWLGADRGDPHDLTPWARLSEAPVVGWLTMAEAEVDIDGNAHPTGFRRVVAAFVTTYGEWAPVLGDELDQAPWLVGVTGPGEPPPTDEDARLAHERLQLHLTHQERDRRGGAA